MLVVFALSPDCLRSLDRPTIRRILRLWKSCGVIYLDQRALDGVPSEMRKWWKRALHGDEDRTATIDFSSIGDYLSLSGTGMKRLAEQVAVFAVDANSGSYFGLNEENWARSTPYPDFELVLASCLEETRHVAAWEEFSHRDVQAGTSADEVWTSRLEGLARHCRNVSVIDPYALAELRTRAGASGLAGLVRRLGQLPGKRHLKVISHVDRWDPPALKKWGETQGWQGVEVYALPEKGFKGITRDRWLRFGSFVCRVGHGVEVMSAQGAKDTNTFATSAVCRDPSGALHPLEAAQIALEQKAKKWGHTVRWK